MHRFLRGVPRSARAATPGFRLIGGRARTPASAALAPDLRPPATDAERCRLAQVDSAAVVLPEHRDQSIRLAGNLVDDGAKIRLAQHDIIEPHLPDRCGARIDE